MLIVFISNLFNIHIYNINLINNFFQFTPNTLGCLFALAIIPTFFGHSLLNWALKWVSTSTISMAIVFEPIGASILAYIILKEHVTWSQWLGGTIVIFGLFLFIVSTTRKPKVTISKR